MATIKDIKQAAITSLEFEYIYRVLSDIIIRQDAMVEFFINNTVKSKKKKERLMDEWDFTKMENTIIAKDDYLEIIKTIADRRTAEIKKYAYPKDDENKA